MRPGAHVTVTSEDGQERAVNRTDTMTNKACHAAPAHGAGGGRYQPSNPRGGSSSEAGSGGSSCESHEDRSIERAELSQEESEGESGMDTIKRNIKLKPDRPPRTIDSKSSASSSSEYYNLCHPPPLGEQPPVPAIPRRAPYISHEGALLAQEKGGQGAQEPRSCHTLGSRCGSRASEGLNSEALNTLSLNRGLGLNTSHRQRLKILNRRRKGSVCSCKHGNSGSKYLLLISRIPRHNTGREKT